ANLSSEFRRNDCRNRVSARGRDITYTRVGIDMTTISLFIVAVIAFVLGMFVWRSRPANQINRSFAAFTLLVALWVRGVASFYTGINLDLWARLTFAAASFLPSTFLAFARHYPDTSRWPTRSWLTV